MSKRVSLKSRPTKKPVAKKAPAVLGRTIEEGLIEVSPQKLSPNPYQPRTVFDEEKLAELAHSIGRDGIIEPIVVRPHGTDPHHIIAGERRWRAAQQARLGQVPVIVKDCTDEEMEILALEENLHREDLNDMDRGRALKSLKERLHMTWEELGQRVGLSRRRVLMLAGLPDLPMAVQKMIEAGDLNEKHSRAVRQVIGEKEQAAFARLVKKSGITGDQALAAVRMVKKDKGVGLGQAVEQVSEKKRRPKLDAPYAGLVKSVQALGQKMAAVEAEALDTTVKRQLAEELETLIGAAQALQNKISV